MVAVRRGERGGGDFATLPLGGEGDELGNGGIEGLALEATYLWVRSNK